MQRLLYNLYSKREFSTKESCTKISIATPTPTSITRRARVVFIKNSRNACALRDRPNLRPFPTFKQFDGFYASKSLRTDDWKTTLRLLEYLHYTKMVYKMSDYDALQLLTIFKQNLNDACRHLCISGSRPVMRLEFDSPWSIQPKSIRELSSLGQFTSLTFYKYFQEAFISNINILPEDPLAAQYSGRYFRVQRTFYAGQIGWVGCMLSTEQEPFEVVTLQFRANEQINLQCCFMLMNEVKQYIMPLIQASKS